MDLILKLPLSPNLIDIGVLKKPVIIKWNVKAASRHPRRTRDIADLTLSLKQDQPTVQRQIIRKEIIREIKRDQR